MSRHPGRRGHQGIVVRYGRRVAAVEVRDANLPAAALVRLVGDLRPTDSLAPEGGEKIIHERVRLPPQRRAGVALVHERGFVELVRHGAGKVCIRAPADQELRGIRRNETETLHVEVELDHVRRLAGDAAQRDGNGLGVAGRDVSRDSNFGWFDRRRPQGKKCGSNEWQKNNSIHPVPLLALTLKLMVTVR